MQTRKIIIGLLLIQLISLHLITSYMLSALLRMIDYRYISYNITKNNIFVTLFFTIVVKILSSSTFLPSFAADYFRSLLIVNRIYISLLINVNINISF